MFVNNIELATAVEGGEFAGDEVNAVQFGKKKEEEEEEEAKLVSLLGVKLFDLFN